MIFPTVQFALFFPIVLMLSWALMKRQWAWKPFIVAMSYVFYSAANPKFCLLLGGLTLANQAAGKLMERVDGDRARKRVVTAAIAVDLGTLGVFKYYGFFAQDINQLFDAAGLGLPVPLVAIALPIGISFIVFQAISYVVDIYRRKIESASTIDFALYLSFFPHLVAGPIVRAREFIPQLATPRDPRNVAVGAGVSLIVLGLVKKVAIADYLAREVVDPVFAVPEAFSAPDVALALYGYSIQAFCDFSGYTDMAIGLALLMGYVFPQNFDRPYRSLSVREFWRRWHMTLSRFLRDYVYIPLGGNRRGRLMTARNLMFTVVLGGLWHGAAWGFILFGTIQGTALVIENVFRDRGWWHPPSWLKWVLTYHLIVLSFIPFRAADLTIAKEFSAQFFDWGPATMWTWPVVGLIVLVLALQLVPAKPIDIVRVRFETLHPAALGAVLGVVTVLVTATVPTQGVPPFIYFQF